MAQIHNYTFRSVDEKDLPVIGSWLKTPEVSRWYDDPEYIDCIRENLTDKRICSQIVLLKCRPFACLQHYDIHAWTDHHLSYLPIGSRGIDTFIGLSHDLYQGHGFTYLALLARQLFKNNVQALGIDPHPENRAAISAYQKAGFKVEGTKESQWGRVVTMSSYLQQ